MALDVVLERDEYAPGDEVRGIVRGLDAGSRGRALRVSLRHTVRHFRRHPGVSTEIELGPTTASEVPFALRLPPDAPASFSGEHYDSRWSVEASLDVPWRRDPRAEGGFEVRAGTEKVPAGAEPVAVEWSGYRTFRRFLGVFVALDLGALAALLAGFGRLPALVVLAFVVPAAVSLAVLALLGLAGRVVERLEARLPRDRWRLGETVRMEVVCEADPGRLVALEAELAGEEVWTESTGQGSRTRRRAFHRVLDRLEGSDLGAARVGARRWEWSPRGLALPGAGPPSAGDAIQWRMRVRGVLPARPDPKLEVALEVSGAVPLEEAE